MVTRSNYISIATLLTLSSSGCVYRVCVHNKSVSKGAFKMHFELVLAILDHVFLHLKDIDSHCINFTDNLHIKHCCNNRKLYVDLKINQNEHLLN